MDKDLAVIPKIQTNVAKTKEVLGVVTTIRVILRVRVTE